MAEGGRNPEEKLVVIRGKAVVLVPYQRKHVPTYHRWMQNPELLEATASEPLTLEEEFENCASWSSDPYKLTFIVLAVTDQKNDSENSEISAMAGDVNLFFDKCKPGTAEIEVMIAEPKFRRNGLAQESLQLLLWWGSSRCGVSRFFCKINESNAASLALFEKKLSFERVAYAECFREHELEFTNEVSEPSTFVSWRPFTEGEEVLSSKDKYCRPQPSTPQVKISYMSGSTGDGINVLPFAAQLMLFGQKKCLVVHITPQPAQQEKKSASQMGALSVAMPSKFESMPHTTTLLQGGGGDMMDDSLSRAVARFLVKLTGITQIYCSSSLVDSDDFFALDIAQQISAYYKRPED